MKKNILLMAFIAIMYSTAFSQIPGFGIFAGPTLSCLKYKTDYSTDKGKMRPGFTVGAFADIGLSQAIHFRPELGYVMKAIKFKESDQSGSWEENRL